MEAYKLAPETMKADLTAYTDAVYCNEFVGANGRF